MKHIAQTSFEDDNPGNEDLDRVFSRLDELNPPADFVQRMMQAVSRLPLPQMLQSDDELAWDDDPTIHPEQKQTS